MEITENDKIELQTMLDIVINQIPNYFNLLNSSKNDWGIQKVDDCVFGMVFNSFVAKSTEYLKNKILDNEVDPKLHANSEYFQTTMSFFNANVPKVKQAISSIST